MLKLLIKTSAASLAPGRDRKRSCRWIRRWPIELPHHQYRGRRRLDDNDINSTTEAETIAGLAGTGTGFFGAYNVTSNTLNTFSALDVNGTSERDYSSPPGFDANAAGGTADDWLVHMTGGIHFANPGVYTVRMQGDDGGRVIMPGIGFTNANSTGAGTLPSGDELRFEGTTGSSNAWAEFTIPVGGFTTTIDAMFFERAGGDYWELGLSFQPPASAPRTSWNITDFPNVLQNGLDGVEFNTSAFDPIPEPAGFALFAVGSLLVLRRRRK